MYILSKDDYDQYEDRMKKTIKSLGENFNALRAGRANPHVLDRITVEYYGVPSPLNSIANIQVPEPRMITLTPWDPSILRDVERAIQASDLGINPSNDGKMIRLLFPILSEERRKELVKSVHMYAEEAKIAVRNIRRDGIDRFRALNKKKELTDDDLKEFEDKIQKITDKYVKEIETLSTDKENDLMEI